jgi:chromosome segregation ATPase
MANNDNRKRNRTESAACADELALTQQSREEYIAGVLQQIEAFEEKLGELEGDMESSGWDDLSDFRGQLDDLRTKLRTLRSQADELETVADSVWPGAYEEMEESLADVAGGVEGLASGLSLVLPE